LALFTLFLEFGSNTQFWHQFGINMALTNDFTVGSMVANLAFLSVSYVVFGIF